MVYIICDDAVDVVMLWCSLPLSTVCTCLLFSSHGALRHTRAGLPRVQPPEQEPGVNCSGTSGPASTGPGQTWENCLEKIISSINSSLRQETIIKGLSCHDSSWTERRGGDLVKVDTITLQPEPGLGHQISHRRGQMVAVNIKILIGPASLWTRVYLHQVRRLEL